MAEDPADGRSGPADARDPDGMRWDTLGYEGREQGRGRIAALDRLSELAARIMSASAAQISLIDEEQHVVGAAGRAVTLPGRIPVTQSLCARVASDGEPLRIADAAIDPRVADLRPVTHGVLGAYLGVPLRVAGVVVGALCVFEETPRSWTVEEEGVLESLAQSVSVELELSSLESNYEGERIIWQLAIDAGGVGAFDWDLVTGKLHWDERLLRLFGLDHDTFGGTIEAFTACVHPDDRQRVSDALDHAIETAGAYDAEYRVVLPSGEVRWIAARGRALAGPDGRTVRLLGAASDTTAVQQEETRVARVLESMPTAFFSLDRTWRFTYANGEAKRLLGAIGVDFVGRVIWEVFPAAVGTEFEQQYRHAMDTGEPVTFEAYYPPPLDARYEVRGWPTPEGLSVYFVDITARHAAQEALDRASSRAALLAEAGAAMADTWEPDTAVRRLAQIVVPALGQWSVVTLADHGKASSDDWRRGLRDAGCWHADEAKRHLVERYAQTRLPALSETSFLAGALRATGPIVINDNAYEAIATVLAPGEARDLCLELAPGAAVVVPLRARGRTLGLMTVFRDLGTGPFAPEAVAVLKELGDRAGLALDNARLYASQRDLAEELQRSMMTPPPEPDHLHIAVRYLPAAEVAQVGGDWYDSFLQPEGATVVVIGDVLGHDTAAAAAMGQLRNMLRGIAAVTDAGPAALLTQVDQAMSRLMIKITASTTVARLEQTPEERAQGLTRLRWSNAGHPPPIVVAHPDSDDDAPRTRVLWGRRSNVLLGLDLDLPRDEQVATLRRGSTLLFYTDGLIERRGEVIDVGIERLAAALTELVDEGLPLEDLCDELLVRMLPGRPDDDVALLAVRLHREDEARPAEAGPQQVPDDVPAPPGRPAAGGPGPVS
ncbi:MAG: SpoIIE family protein phosphatase [Nocardioides sp.]